MSGGWDWSDLLVHVAIGSSILHGNFPPEVPYFAGVPLTYHWFADFHGAIAATASGIDLIPVYFATSALFAGVLALVVWALALRLTGDRRVALVATILVCLGGGMGWIRLVLDLVGGQGDIGTLITQHPYDNNWEDAWPFFRIASVLGTGFFPHRATTLGLPGLVSVVLLVASCLGRRPAGVLLAGILAALLAPFHFYAFPATYLIVALYVLTTGAWRAPTVGRDAVLFLAPVVLAIPFVADAIFQQGATGGFRFVLGWGEARVGEGPIAVLFFYATNLGLPFALAILGAFAARDLPTRWFLVAWMVVLFLVPNVVVLSAVEFDMNKYFQMMWIAVAILAAWFIRRWSTVPIVLVLAVSAVSPGLVAYWHLTNPAVVMTAAQERAAHWIEAETPGALGLRDRRVHQQSGRPRGPAADPDLPALRVESRLRPRVTRGRHHRHLLRWARHRGPAHGDLRRHVRALERWHPRLSRPADRFRVERSVRDGLRPGRRHGLAPAVLSGRRDHPRR